MASLKFYLAIFALSSVLRAQPSAPQNYSAPFTELRAQVVENGRRHEHAAEIEAADRLREWAEQNGTPREQAEAYRLTGVAQYRAAHYLPALEAFRRTIV